MISRVLFILISFASLHCLRQGISPENVIAVQEYLEKLEKQVDKSSWVDPYDMFSSEFLTDSSSLIYNDYTDELDLHTTEHFGIATIDMKTESHRIVNVKVQKEERKFFAEKQCEKTKVIYMSNDNLNHSAKESKRDNIFLNRWLKIFLNKFPNFESSDHDERKIVSFFISRKELQEIKSVVDEKIPNFSRIDDVISSVLHQFTVEEEQNWFSRYVLNYWKQTTCVIVILIFLVFYMFTFPKLTLFISFCVVSISWQWMELYQEAIAKKQADLEKIDFPASCKKHELGILENIRLWMTSFVVSQGTCQDYYKALMVDPFWEVTPSMALSATVSRFSLYPFEVLAVTLNNSIGKLFKDMSFLQITILIFFLFLILVMVFKYRIRSPFIFTFEPAVSCSAHDNNKVTALAVNKEHQIVPLLVKDRDILPPCDCNVTSIKDSQKISHHEDLQIKDHAFKHNETLKSDDLNSSEKSSSDTSHESLVSDLARLNINNRTSHDSEDVQLNHSQDLQSSLTENLSQLNINDSIERDMNQFDETSELNLSKSFSRESKDLPSSDDTSKIILKAENTMDVQDVNTEVNEPHDSFFDSNPKIEHELDL